MANDLVIKLLLKTGAFSNDLKTAKGQIQDFQSKCNTAGNSLNAFGKSFGINLGTITKFGTAVGLATAAGKELKAIMESSQTTADRFQGAIAGAKGVIDQFNTSIATGNFSAFNDGLWTVYETARRVAEAMDQLTNTQIAYDFMTKANHTKFNEAYNIFKDPNATQAMKEAAKAQMKEAIDEQYEYASNYNRQAYLDYVAQVVNKAGSSNITGNRVTTEQFRKAMEIDLSYDPAKGRADNAHQYQNYLDAIAEYETSTLERLRTGNRYNNLTAVEDIKKKYADVIAIHAMLELMSDNELQGLAGILQGMESVKQEAIAMEKQFNRINDGTEKVTSGTTTKAKEEQTAHEKSLKYLDDEIKRLKDEQMRIEYNTGAWRELGKTIEELEARRQRMIDSVTPLPKIDTSKFPQMQNYGLGPISESGLKMKFPEPPEQTFNKWDEFNQTMSSTAQIVSGMATAFQEGTEITAASILQMVAQTLPAVGSLIGALAALSGVEATEKAVSTSKHWIEAIAAVAALGGVVAAAVASAKNAGKFANGGIVGGNSYTGDRLTANVNSGEMILNRTQQANLFRQINNGGGAGQVEFHISGTELYGVLNNYNRKSRLTR